MHAVGGLLKNLSLAAPNLPLLREAKVIQHLAKSDLWSQKFDMAEVVQVAAIGIAKMVCNGDCEPNITPYFFIQGLTNHSDKSALDLCAPALSSPSGFDQIVALAMRSDSVIVQSEGARVVVQVTKALWRTLESQQQQPSELEALKEAMRKVVSRSPIEALTGLLARSQRHVVLLNESIIALTLIAGQSVGSELLSFPSYPFSSHKPSKAD